MMKAVERLLLETLPDGDELFQESVVTIARREKDMSDILSRTAEALLAGAASSDPSSSGIDFRLERMSNYDWQVAAVFVPRPRLVEERLHLCLQNVRRPNDCTRRKKPAENFHSVA